MIVDLEERYETMQDKLLRGSNKNRRQSSLNYDDLLMRQEFSQLQDELLFRRAMRVCRTEF
jgi:hypothetical protein